MRLTAPHEAIVRIVVKQVDDILDETRNLVPVQVVHTGKCRFDASVVQTQSNRFELSKSNAKTVLECLVTDANATAGEQTHVVQSATTPTTVVVHGGDHCWHPEA